MKTYEELRKINVNEHIEKKNNLSYLSWAWAVDILFQHDPEASWEYLMFEGKPWLTVGVTSMVFCKVTAFGRARTAQLPIMDYRNKAIVEFTSFDLNTTMQRCLAKAISLHGIGLYIYAGEDLPPENDDGNAATRTTPVKKENGATSHSEKSEKSESPGQIVDQAIAMEGMAPEVSKAIRDEALKIGVDFYQVGAKAALGSWLAFKKTAGEQEIEALWQHLDSKVRSGIKKAGQTETA